MSQEIPLRISGEMYSHMVESFSELPEMVQWLGEDDFIVEYPGGKQEYKAVLRDEQGRISGYFSTEVAR